MTECGAEAARSVWDRKAEISKFSTPTTKVCRIDWLVAREILIKSFKVGAIPAYGTGAGRISVISFREGNTGSNPVRLRTLV